MPGDWLFYLCCPTIKLFDDLVAECANSGLVEHNLGHVWHAVQNAE